MERVYRGGALDFGPELANPVRPEVLAMAELNRQRKKGIPVWVLLLALIVLALLVWFFWANPKREHAARPENVIELRAPALVHELPATRCA
jgi:hypothetical protein